MKQLKSLLYVLVGLVLFGCAGTSVVSRDKAAQAPYKLTSATIMWIDNASLPYEILATGRGYQPKIEESDKAYARIVVGTLLNKFRTSTVPRIREQFTQKNVAEGKGTFLEITPTTANLVLGGGRGFTIRASIKESLGGKEIWSVTIKAFGPSWEKDEVLLENFVSTLIAELKNSGWVA